MKIRTLIVLLLLPTILFLINPVCGFCGEDESASIAILKPGKGIGNINIGDKLDDVVKKMGKKPSEGKTITQGETKEYWLMYNSQGITFAFNEDSKLVGISVTNPGVRIQSNNIGINSSSTDLERSYGAPSASDQLGDNHEWKRYQKYGVEFLLNKETRKIKTIKIKAEIK